MTSIISLMKNFKSLILMFSLVTAGIIILSFGIALFLKPDLMEIMNWTDRKGFTMNKTQSEKFLQYIINNGVKVPFQMFILAFIPIQLVYYLPVALTAAVTGIIFYLPLAPQLQDKMSFFNIFSGVFPHASIEFLSFCIISAVLCLLNTAIRGRLFNKVNSETGVVNALKKVTIAYCFVAFPMLVIAAFIEAFITPMIA